MTFRSFSQPFRGSLCRSLACAAALATRSGPAYMEEFNESIRSMSGEHETGVYINRGWGVFNTIKAAPPAEPVASARIALVDTSGASAVQRTTAQAHRPAPVAADSRMS